MSSSEEILISYRIKKIRIDKGLTLEEVAQKTGFTKGQISKIENNKASPPIATLVKIANALGVGLSQLFSEDLSASKVTFIKKDQRATVVREGLGPGYIYENLAHGYNNRKMEPFIITIDSTQEKVNLFDHEGEEFILVLEGQMEYLFGEKVFSMEEGDSLYFDSSISHGPRLIDNKKVVFLAVFLNK